METIKNSDVRVSNRKRVVNTLFREGTMTKQELALKLDISLATVTFLLKELSQKGLITKGEVLSSTGGRKPIRIAPVYNAKYAIGAEVSMHELRIVLVDLGANVIVSEDYPLGLRNTGEYWEKLNAILMDFINRNIKDREKLLDIGITLQLPMHNGEIILKEDIKEQCNIDEASEYFELPVKFYNSAKVAAIAQVWALNDRENFIFFTLGSYIGGAMIYDSVIIDFSGKNGEFGDIVIAPKDKQQTINDFCTTRVLCERAGVQGLKEFFEQIKNCDKKCCELWEEYLEILSLFLHNLYKVFGWKIVIGGSMSPYLEQYYDIIENRLKELAGYNKDFISYIKVSDLGKFGAAIGAALLPIDTFLDFGYDEL